MKFNFGTGLFIGAVLFMTFVVVLVVKIMKTDVPLVEDNYYEKGIRYQEKINMSNIDNLSTNIRIESGMDNNEKLINFSKTSLGDTIAGKAYFYRPSDKQKDFTIDVILVDTNVFPFNVSKLEKGIWKIKFTCRLPDGKPYYTEKELVF